MKNGLNLWAPVVNLLRDPRWGRNEEGYSEDATLTGAISTAYGSGITGPDPDHLQAAPTLKHYLAYNVEDNRSGVSAVAPPRVLNEYDRQAFEPAISADAATGVMASYNIVNGRPTHLVSDLETVIRSWTDRELMNVGDAWGVGSISDYQKYYATTAEAHSAAISAGIDVVTENSENSAPSIAAVKEGLAKGLLTEADIDQAVRHSLSVRFRLGDFDPPGVNPYAEIGPEVINDPEHGELAREAAREQMVLLKNSPGALPLKDSETSSVAVVGQLANTLYQDWYSGTMPYRITPRQGISKRLGAQAAVTATEGVDRVALKSLASGKYVTAPGGETGGLLVADADTAGEAQSLDVFDWGEGISALRAASNGRYLTLSGWPGNLRNSEVQPNGWFVQQQFKLIGQSDGTVVIQYAGNEIDDGWFHQDLFVVEGTGGVLTLGASEPEAATKFAKEVLVSGVDSAVAAARSVDVAVVVVGNMPFINGREDDDRKDLNLSAGQQAVLEAVTAANPNTVLVLESSYPVTIGWAQEHVPAILWTSHAGQETGRALAEILFGDYSPAGRVPQTWYASQDQLPDKLEFDIINAGWTYQYFEGDPLYAFGHGLSYTSFRYGKLRVEDSRVDGDDTVAVSVEVTNTGAAASDEVVQLYSRQRTSRVKQPEQSLRAFDRVSLAPGETKRVTLSFPASELAFWDVTRDRFALESGAYDLMVGPASDRIERRKSIDVKGEKIPHRDLSVTTDAEDWDAQQGTTLVDETKVDGTAVSATQDGAWLQFAGSNVRRGTDRLVAQVTRSEPGAGSLAVRLDDPVSGPVLATVDVPATADRYTWTAVEADLGMSRGVRDVYLVLDSGTSVAEFSLPRR